MNMREDSFTQLDDARQHLEQAYAYEDKGNPVNALRECELSIQLAPTLAEAHNLRGIVLDELGRKEEAVAAYREAVRLAPAFREAQENLSEAEAELRGGHKEFLSTKAASAVEGKMKRPGSIKAICFFYWLSALVLLAILAVTTLALVGPYLTGALPPSRMLEEILEPGVLPVCGLFFIAGAFLVSLPAVGWGLWRLKSWARYAAIVVSCLFIVFNLVMTIIALAGGSLQMPFGIILHGVILFWLFREDVKVAFEPTSQA